MFDHIRNLCVLVALSMIVSAGSAVACSPSRAPVVLPTPQEVYDLRNFQIDDAQGIYLARVVSVEVYPESYLQRAVSEFEEDGIAVVSVNSYSWNSDSTWPYYLNRLEIVETLSGSHVEFVVVISPTPFGWARALFEGWSRDLSEENLEINARFYRRKMMMSDVTFDDHQYGLFWSFPALHHTGLNADCSEFRLFRDGQMILVFTGNETQAWNLEPIVSEDDQWLMYVRDRTAQ